MTATLEVGRELDALVAHSVLASPVQWNGGEPYYLNHQVGSGWLTCPYFSTEIGAAWRLVEKIRCTKEAPDEVYWILTDCADQGWRADIKGVLTENDAPVDYVHGEGETLPIAICRAALAWYEPEKYA